MAVGPSPLNDQVQTQQFLEFDPSGLLTWFDQDVCFDLTWTLLAANDSTGCFEVEMIGPVLGVPSPTPAAFG